MPRAEASKPEERPPRPRGLPARPGPGEPLPLSGRRRGQRREGTLGRGGPLTAGPGLRYFSGQEERRPKELGVGGIGREKSSHPTRRLLSTKKGVRNSRAEEPRPPGKTLRFKWRRRLKPPHSPLGPRPPAARGGPAHIALPGSRAGVPGLRHYGICSSRVKTVKGTEEESACYFRDALRLL